jgi:hypothetical protein
MLPCPVCAGSVKGENLEKHLAKVHPGAAPPASPWRGKGALGLFPCSLAIGDALVLRHTLGLAERVLSFPASVEAGSLWTSQGDATMSSYGDDINVAHTDVKAGRYIRVQCPRSRIGITVGCRGGVPLAGHWTGWTQGERRRSADLVIARDAMVAFEYALVERGLLKPRVA